MIASNKIDHSVQETFLTVLEKRFTQHIDRHKELDWENIKAKLLNQPEKLWCLLQMENTGGEPDVVFFNEEENTYTFYDCATESPIGRRSLCYDRAALEARKDHKPENTVIDFVTQIGVELLNEEQYRFLQTLGSFDTKTSSWLTTPPEIRKLGGAIFADRRYNTVFIYHNGAQSYYAARGFRVALRV